MANLVLLQAGQSTSYALTATEAVIGRHPECTVQVDSNMVSRKHARVFKDGEGWYIEDLGSGNGTVVNGQKILAKTQLNHEDRIKLGPILFRFEGPQVPRPDLLPPTAHGGQLPKDEDFGGATIDFKLATGSDDTAMVMGATSAGGESSRFGALDVQPEAKLKAILEISRSLAGTVALDAMLPKMLDTLFTVFPGADRGCILLKDVNSGEMIPRAIKHRRESEDSSVRLSRTIVNKVLTEKTGILSADAANDSRFQASESISSLTIRSMMCVPLLGLNGNPIGLINIDTQNPLKQFRPDDLDLLMAVAGQAALSYENAQLVVSHMEKMKQDNEMQIAARVQRALLPEKLPERPGYQFFATYDSAQAVGGDYYDCVVMPKDKICLAFGDVAGKGVPASLVMSRLAAVVQNTMEFVQDAGEAVKKINDNMCVNAIEGRFVTFTLTILDMKTHEMQTVIAGHMSPIIRKPDGSLEELPEEVVGVPLGVMDGIDYEVCRRKLAPGETVVIYTDGVSEAMDPKNVLYGVEHLRQFITKGSPQPDVLGKAILADVRRHANGRAQNDDITLMVFGRNA